MRSFQIRNSSIVLLVLLQASAGAHADSSSVSVALTGRVSPVCRIAAANPDVTIGEINRQGTASIAFLLSCNSDFYVSVSSRNGGLSYLRGQPGSAAFTALIPYAAVLQFGGSNISGTCRSDGMHALPAQCVGTGAAAPVAMGANAAITLQWSLQDKQPLAGVYQDVLTVKVSPRL